MPLVQDWPGHGKFVQLPSDANSQPVFILYNNPGLTVPNLQMREQRHREVE